MDMMKKVPVREQAPEIRAHNFEEVCLGYNEEEAVFEASRCLNCKNAKCILSCPVSINIPAFIQAIKNREFFKASDIIAEASALPAICGRVCPQETQCEGSCVRGVKGEAVSIGKLERFTADYAREKGHFSLKKEAPNGIKVGIVGSGPAGLTCAGDLLKLGYDVTIFEALHKAGGVLSYGIPEFRLPKDSVVKQEIQNVISLGAKLELNTIVGKTVSVDSLINEEGFKAIFVGSGAGLPNFMNIEGENANNVFSANEFLTRANLMKGFSEDYDTPVPKGTKAVIVGGGNVAMDAARTALRLGFETDIVYRRSMSELPARIEEIHHAEEEGVTLKLLQNPTRILTDENGNVTGVEVIKMELGEPDASGRRRPVEIPGSEYIIPCDLVVIAIGNSPNPLIPSSTKGLEVNRKKCIVINEETMMTSRDGIFAGGDAVSGAATVILAMQAGKNAAKGIDAYLKENR